MNRKVLEALANQLALSRPEPGNDNVIGPGDLEQWRNDCYAIAKACEAHYPRFDFDVFIDWCNQ